MHDSTLTILDMTYLPIGALSGKSLLYQLSGEGWQSSCKACQLCPLPHEYNGMKQAEKAAPDHCC